MKAIIFLVLYLAVLPGMVYAQWDIREPKDNNVVCLTSKGLVERFKEVNKITQVSNNDEKTWVKYPCTIADRPFAENKAEALEAGVSEQRAQGVGVMGLVFSDDFIMSAQRVLFTDNNSIGYRPANVWEKSKFGIHPVCLARKTEVDGVLIYGYRYTEGNLSDQLMVQYCTTPIPGKQEDINQAWCVYTSGNNCQTQKIIGESPNQKAEAFEACQEEKKSRIQACEKKKKDKKKEACIKKAQAVSCANL